MFGDAYWSIYKRVEKEVIDLSYNVYFDDNQLKVYSNGILDLILRISTNIESLYEEIYRDEFHEDKGSIYSKINKIGKLFSLEEKVIYISNENFHFKKQMKEIRPFASYKKDDENDFYSAYCALKHDRGKNIGKANIHFLLRSLAAFYTLCVIFDDKWTPIQNSIFGSKTPYTHTYNSEIFSAKVYDKQLDFAQQSIAFLAMKIDNANKSKDSCVSELLSQCEKNLKVKFRDQNPKECLFIAELTPEYLQNLNDFQNKYSKNKTATETELGLIFGDHNNEKTFEKLGIDSLDVLMDHIKMNLEKTIAYIAVNRDDGEDRIPV